MIFCRNVLMYFEQEQRDAIVANFSELLSKRGWFVVSPAEAAFIQHPALTPFKGSGPHVFRKGKAEKEVRHFVPWADVKPPTGDGAVSFTPFDLPPVTAKKDPGAFAGASTVPSAATQKPQAETRPSPEPVRPSPSFILKEARALHAGGQLVDAAALLRTYLKEAKPGGGWKRFRDHEVIALLAKIEADRGELEQAEEWYMAAIEADSLETDYHYLLAMTLLEQGKPEKAIAVLGKVLFLEPDFILAHLQLAALNKDRRRSRKFAENVIAILADLSSDAAVPFSEGMTAGAIRTMALNMM